MGQQTAREKHAESLTQHTTYKAYKQNRAGLGLVASAQTQTAITTVLTNNIIVQNQSTSVWLAWIY